MARLLIVAGVKLYRDGLVQVLEGRPGLRVVAAAAHVHEALTQASGVEADIALVDMTATDAPAAIQALMRLRPGIRVVGLGLSEFREDNVLECIQAGLSGYVPLNGSVDDLIATLEHVSRGEMVCPPRITAGLARRLSFLGGDHPGRGASLTSRERQVAGLIDRGLANKDIAQILRIEIATVKNHVHSILDKLRVHTRGEAAARLRRYGFVPRSEASGPIV